MLVQSPTVFIRNTITVLNVQRNDADFVDIAVRSSARVSMEHRTHVLDFSAVQEGNHFLDQRLGCLPFGRETGCAVLLDRCHSRQLRALEDTHTLLGDIQV